MTRVELIPGLESQSFEAPLSRRTNTAVDFATVSIAISLKRIADSLANIDGVFDPLSSRNR